MAEEKSAMVYLKKMQEMFSKGKNKELNEFCREKLQYSHEDIDLLFFYGVTLNELGEHKKAKNIFRKLFNLTHDRLFLTCESISEFDDLNRADALESLSNAIREGESLGNLFLAFRVAFENSEIEAARHALYMCFRRDPKKTISRLQEFFEKKQIKDADKRIKIVKMLNTLKDILNI
ncbi:MAG: hypothetical protein ACLFUZ_02515 [Candidatus Micrarchaeia archaeon]